MPRVQNQKDKILYLNRILHEQTDEEHPLGTVQLIAELERCGIRAERKSVYDDIETLKRFGVDIEYRKAAPSGYYIAGRLFELPELKLLVDAAQSSRFITHKKSGELIRKLESLASVHEARSLQRQVFVANRIKTVNESIYYNVDKLHTAIHENRKISFRYYDWLPDKTRLLRKGGAEYLVSPWALSWQDENYYLIAYDPESSIIKHYRVDRMTRITVKNEARDGRAEFSEFDLALYTKKMFGMFGGEIRTVRLKVANRLAGVIIDRFGKESSILTQDDGTFVAIVEVAVSPQFFSWIFGLGDGVEILAPDDVVSQMRDQLKRSLRGYRDHQKLAKK